MDSKMRGIVRCEPHNKKWEEEFKSLKTMLFNCLGDLIIDIEHVGSTSVDDLIAKPILDIDIVFESYDVFPKIVERLEGIGFIHQGDQGIKNREVFKRSYEDEFMPYHLYACPKDSEELLRHLSFREYLRANKQDREIYGNLKMELARRFPRDIDSYIDGKDNCVKQIYENIVKQNALFKRYPISDK